MLSFHGYLQKNDRNCLRYEHVYVASQKHFTISLNVYARQGTPQFCPLVFRTRRLEEYIGLDLLTRATGVVEVLPKHLLVRSAASLLLKDSRSSFAIEGEHPSPDRIQRWGRAIGQAGRQPIDLDELPRLQSIVIGDTRFDRLGLRSEGGFAGEFDGETRMPVPEHISARAEDLIGLVEGMTAFDRQMASQPDPVARAAVLAFGFVYIHPLEDGNGRLHRYLILHVLARRGFNPPGVVFPISASVLERIDEYRNVIGDYSLRQLPVPDWRPTDQGNVLVLNETGDWYRFFDATPHAEFLYECMRQTVERDLPQEAEVLKRYDEFRSRLNLLVDMPDRLSDLLFRFLQNNGGKLSRRGRKREFAALTDLEVTRIEEIYRDSFPDERARRLRRIRFSIDGFAVPFSRGTVHTDGLRRLLTACIAPRVTQSLPRGKGSTRSGTKATRKVCRATIDNLLAGMFPTAGSVLLFPRHRLTTCSREQVHTSILTYVKFHV